MSATRAAAQRPPSSAQFPTSTAGGIAVAGAVLAIALPLFIISAARACADLEIRNVNVRACDKNSVMRRFDVNINLKQNCMLTFKTCFNVTRKVSCSQVNYKIEKPKSPVKKNGEIDACKEAEELFEKEKERLQSSGGGGGGNNQKGKKKVNKWANLRCPYNKGRRCITQTLDVSDMKKYRSHLIGNYIMEATADHCNGPTSCMTGNFSVVDVAAKSGR